MVSTIGWDAAKGETNWRKHGVHFSEAQTVFADPLNVSIPDPDHSAGEDRFLAIGESVLGRLLVVSYAVGNREVRIISARTAMPAERRRYMRGDEIRDEVAETEDIPPVDFSGGVRGRHIIVPRGAIAVEIEPVVAEFFRDAASVNAALRMLIAEGRAPDPLWREDSVD